LEKLLAIYDPEILYASRLMEYFRKSEWEGFEILLFTGMDHLTDFLKYQKLEILLYGGEALLDKLSLDNVRYIFLLSSNNKPIRDKYQRIYKYQSASKIKSDILSSYTRLEDNNKKAAYDDVRFISIYPPVSGPEKLTFAWFLAKELSNNYKVLFISMEMLATSFITGDEVISQSMSEYLYYLKESKEGLDTKLKSYLSYSEKLSYLSGLSHGFDLLSLSKEDIVRLMDMLKEQGDYELVIFYLGFYSEASMEILNRSTDVYIALCDIPYEEFVYKEWERQMELIGLINHQCKYRKIKLSSLYQGAGSNSLHEISISAIKPLAKEMAKHM
jgi:hypothetical protein